MPMKYENIDLMVNIFVHIHPLPMQLKMNLYLCSKYIMHLMEDRLLLEDLCGNGQTLRRLSVISCP